MTQKTPLKGYVKTQTMMLFIFIAFFSGFLGGIVLAIYKSGTDFTSTSESQSSASEAPAPTNEEAGMIRELVAKTAGNPKDTEAWTRLGHLYFDTNQPGKAVEAYEAALKLDPSSANVWTDLGVMYRRSNRPKDAIQAFDKAMQLDPRHEISRFNKGVVLMHDLNDMKGAVKAWKALVEINPLATAPTGQSVDEMIRSIENPPKQ